MTRAITPKLSATPALWEKHQTLFGEPPHISYTAKTCNSDLLRLKRQVRLFDRVDTLKSAVCAEPDVRMFAWAEKFISSPKNFACSFR